MSSATNAAVQAPLAPPNPATLTITGEPWRSLLAHDGKVALARPVVQIGRLEGNDVVLTDPLASRHHAVIRWAPDGYELEDLGSANGTYLNGQRVQGKTRLQPGQTIRIGGTELRFETAPAAGAAGTSAGAGVAPGFAGAFGPGGAPPQGQAFPAGPYAGNAPTQQVPPGYPQAAYARPGAFPPPGGYPPPYNNVYYPYYAVAQRRDNAFVRFVKTQWPKRYWRIFLIGLLAYILLDIVLVATGNLHLVPLVLILASALVPVVFVVFCWEQNAFADMPSSVVGLTFGSGAIFGLAIAAILEPIFLAPFQSSGGGIGLTAAIIVGVIEESAKALSVIWFIRDRRLHSELDGVILGAAAGMGFAALETAGYGFNAFLTGFVDAASQQGATLSGAIGAAIVTMNVQLLLRMALAVFGHGVWTAIVVAAIWRERGNATFRLTPGVLIAFATSVGLHALWDWNPLAAIFGGLTLFFWYPIVGLTGIFILRFFLRESLQRAKLGPNAPPPPPLVPAFFADTFGVGRPKQQPWGPIAAPAGFQWPYPPQGGRPPAPGSQGAPQPWNNQPPPPYR